MPHADIVFQLKNSYPFNLRSACRHYLSSPFLHWAVFSLILDVSHSISGIDSIRTSLWVNYVYLAIFIPLFAANFFVMIPVAEWRKAKPKRKVGWKLVLLIAGSLSLLVSLDMPIFLADVALIIGEQHPESVIDHQKFTNLIWETKILSFSLPMINYILLLPTRKFIEDNIKGKIQRNRNEEFQIAFPWVFMSLIISLIFVNFANIHV